MTKVNETMPLDIVRFIADTVHMDAEQTGAYVMGFMTQWNTGPLPNDLRQCARIMRLYGESAEATAAALLDKYFEQQPDGTWINLSNQSRRLEAETKAKRYSDRAVKANEVRWAGHTRKYPLRNPYGILQGRKSAVNGVLMESNKDSNRESSIGIPENLVPEKNSPSLRSGGRAAAPPARPPVVLGVGNRVEKKAPELPNEAAKANGKRKRTRMPQDAPQAPEPPLRSTVAPEKRNNPVSDFSGEGLKGPSDPAKPKKSPDPRFGSFRREFFAFWKGANPRAVKYPWGVSDGSALNRLLRRNRDMTLEQFTECMENRAQSDGVNTARPAHEWLDDLLRYAAGSLNTFGELKRKAPLKARR